MNPNPNGVRVVKDGTRVYYARSANDLVDQFPSRPPSDFAREAAAKKDRLTRLASGARHARKTFWVIEGGG